jgi:hypothetical protein
MKGGRGAERAIEGIFSPAALEWRMSRPFAVDSSSCCRRTSIEEGLPIVRGRPLEAASLGAQQTSGSTRDYCLPQSGISKVGGSHNENDPGNTHLSDRASRKWSTAISAFLARSLNFELAKENKKNDPDVVTF